MLITALIQWSFRHRRIPTDESMINYVQMITIFFGLLIGLVVVSLWQRQDDAARNTVTEANQVRIIADLSRSVNGNKVTLEDALGDYVQSVIKKEWPMMLTGEQRELYLASPELDSVRVAVMQFEPKNPTEEAATREMLNHYELMLGARQQRLLDSQLDLPSVLRLSLLTGATLYLGMHVLHPVEASSCAVLVVIYDCRLPLPVDLSDLASGPPVCRGVAGGLRAIRARTRNSALI